eukprot:PITA_17769
MIMQLDIAKAYDKVNWIYIKKVLTTFGFDHNWVRWVMALVTSSSFSILVNGSPSELFLPSRGLRQGDPLSPFLFILMMEGLGRSMKHARVIGKIQGLQLSKNGQVLTHQLFVDDTMLQGIPTVKEALAYKQILNDFAKATEETRKKWTLVSWEKICKPKNQGGLGLDNPEILNKALGAKLWWRCVKDPKAQWASIWKEKSANAWPASEIIRMIGTVKGSPIWNIREGDLALFWEDKWQQEPNLLKEEFLGLKHETDNQGLVKVKDFWENPHNVGKWRIWKKIEGREDRTLNSKAKSLKRMLDHRIILVAEGQDQLRWGNNKDDNFNIKEAKGFLLDQEPQAPNKTWQKLWRHKAWDLLSSFIIWNVWKEKNKIIFKEVKTASHSLVKLIVKQLKEAVGTTVRNLPKNPPSGEESRILQLLDMQGFIPQGLDRKARMRDKVEEF